MDMVSIVIPTLNESENINPLLERVFKNCNLEKIEVIFVDDDSSDGTVASIQRWQKTYPVSLIKRKGKNGLSSAVIDGVTAAHGNIIVVMDADLSHPPEKIPVMVSKIIDEHSDMVIGSRYIEGGSTPDWPLSRKLTSKLATLMARPFTSTADPMSGFFAVRKELIGKLNKDVPGFKIGFELLANRDDTITVSEVPIEFLDRTSGISKLGRSAIFGYLFQLVSLILPNFSLKQIYHVLIRYIVSGFADFFVVFALSKAGIPFLQGQVVSFGVLVITYLTHDTYYLITGNNKSGLTRKLVIPSVLLALVFLRGGILASFSQINQWSPVVSIFATNGIMLLLCGTGLYFLRRVKNGQTGLQRATILIIAVYAFILKLSYSGVFELMHQEAYYWNYAMHPSIGYLDHPPMVGWIIWFFSTIFGSSEIAVRAGAPLCWLIMAVFTYKLTTRLFDKQTALVSILLLSVLPFYFGIGILMTPDAPLSAAWAGTLYFLYRALADDKHSAWIMAGICLGAGLLSKYTIILLVPATFIILILDSRYRKWLARPEPYLALVIALVVFLPVIIWNAENQWASFNFQGARRFQGAFVFSFPELILSMLTLLTPVGVLAAFSVLRSSIKRLLYQNNNHNDKTIQKHLFFLVYSITPLSVFFFFSLVRNVKLNWTGPLWLVLIPLFSYFIMSAVNNKENKSRLFSAKVWSVTATSSILLFGIVLYYLTIGIPGISFPDNVMLLGWNELGEKIEEISRGIESKNGEKPIVVGLDKYKTASGLAFYRTKAFKETTNNREDTPAYNTSGRHLLGRGSLMYEYWFPTKKYEKRDMILVSASRDKLSENCLKANSEGKEKIVKIPLTKNGKEAGSIFYAIIERDSHVRRGKRFTTDDNRVFICSLHPRGKVEAL